MDQKVKMLDQMITKFKTVDKVHMLGISANTDIFRRNYMPVLEKHPQVRYYTDATRFANLFRRDPIKPGTALKDLYESMLPIELFDWVSRQISNNINFLNPPDDSDTWSDYAIQTLIFSPKSVKLFDKDIRSSILQSFKEKKNKYAKAIGYDILQKSNNLERLLKVDQDQFSLNFCDLMGYMSNQERQYIRNNRKKAQGNAQFWNIVMDANDTMIDEQNAFFEPLIDPKIGSWNETITLAFALQDMRNRKGTREGNLSGIFAITELDQELLGLSNDPREIIANPNILMMT
jgi:hypothetical protein